jgi:hypothetical protein
MARDSGTLRRRHFNENWLAWAALHHFLPANLVRELAQVIVREMSGGDFTADDLFEEAVTPGPGFVDSWILQPLEPGKPLGEFLQRLIRGIAWQNDVLPNIPLRLRAPGPVQPSVLEKAIRLGAADLGWSDAVYNELKVTEQNSIETLWKAITTAKATLMLSPGDFAHLMRPLFEAVEQPLAATITKHLGDLCADADAWALAEYLYAEAGRLFQEIDPAWDEYVGCLRQIIIQSRAAAMWTLKGPNDAAKILSEALVGANLGNSPLLLLNGSHDALVASYSSIENLGKPDRRATIVLPPLLGNTHTPSSALKAWLEGDAIDSQRQFWALLRRQILLGLVSESRTTKWLYARSIVDSLDVDIEKTQQPDLFQLALRLLLESGNFAAVSRIRWNTQLVDTYVNETCVEHIIRHAGRYPGSYLDRERVLIELFLHWAEFISIDQTAVADRMLKHVADLATKASASLLDSQNLGGRSLEVLRQVAEKRPELRTGIRSEVTGAVISKMSTGSFWKAHDTAIAIAEGYADVFSQEQLQTIIDATLSILGKTDPASNAWPIVRRGLGFLVCDPVKQLARSLPDVAKRIIDTVLRFGVQQQSEHARVLFYLHDFDPDLLHDPSIASRLRESVIHVRQQSQSNASNVVENIQALLIAPAIAGIEGTRDALNGLSSILRSASAPQPAIALPVAYEPLLLLASDQQRIAEEISVSIESFRTLLYPILDLVISLWRRATDHPLLFAPFSFPPRTKPNSTMVHNWAYASIVFAESLGRGDEILHALEGAAAQSLLADPIALARATRSLAGDVEVAPASIRSENRESFYSAMGRRLALLEKIDLQRRTEICKAMLDQCFRHGPRDLDATVFLSASHLNLGGYVSQKEHFEYLRRVEQRRELQLALFPILEMLGVKPKS